MHNKLVLFLLTFSRKRYDYLIFPDIFHSANLLDGRVGGGGSSVLANSYNKSP